MTLSWPARALTSIIKVLLGGWKLVSSRSTTWNGEPRVMKMSVSLALPAARPARRRLEGAQGGGAHGHHAVSACARACATASTVA